MGKAFHIGTGEIPQRYMLCMQGLNLEAQDPLSIPGSKLQATLKLIPKNRAENNTRVPFIMVQLPFLPIQQDYKEELIGLGLALG